MNNKIINKISLDNDKYIEINGTLDLNSKKLEFKISHETFYNIFKITIKELIFNSQSIDREVIYVSDTKGIYYSCFNCIFGFKCDDKNVIIYTGTINFIYENIITNTQNIKVNKLTFITSFPKKFSLYIKDFEFKMGRKNISINKKIVDDKLFVDYSIKNDEEVSYNRLADILYSIIELTFLYLGDIPKIEETILYNKSIIKMYYKSAQKYIQRSNIYGSSTNGILSYVSEETISYEIIKNFIKFRKNTKILFDLLMTHMNSDGYHEITNLMLIQLLEGLFRTTHPGSKKELWEILEYYFTQNFEIKSLMVKRDLKDAGDVHHTPIFLYKAKEHRHFLSHLNMCENKKVFYRIENIYAFWKLSLCLRIYIMQILSIKINTTEYDSIKESIERWAISVHLRYKC